MGIAPAAPATLGDNKVLAGGHIHNNLIAFGIPNHRAPGHLDGQCLTPFAVTVFSGAVSTGLGGVFSFITEVKQGRHIVIDLQNDITAVTAVAAVRAAGCHIFFPVKGNGAVTAATADDGDAYFIYKHRISSFVKG